MVQLSDTHISTPGGRLFNGVDSAVQLQKAIDWILSAHTPVDAVLISGDLTQDGHLEQYQYLRQLLSPLAALLPIYLVLGNHDHCRNVQQVFFDYPGIDQTRIQNYLQYSVAIGSYQLVVLDSLQMGDDQGHLSPERLAWLSQVLRMTHGKIMLAVHHPLISVGNVVMDKMRLYEHGALGDVIEKHTSVELIVSGHIHRTIFSRFRNIPVVICPSTAHQYPVDLTSANAKVLSPEAPGFLLHQQGVGGLVTHLIPLSNYFPLEQ